MCTIENVVIDWTVYSLYVMPFKQSAVQFTTTAFEVRDNNRHSLIGQCNMMP